MDNVYENITDIFSSENFNGKIGKIKGNDKLFTNFYINGLILYSVTIIFSKRHGDKYEDDRKKYNKTMIV